MQNLESRTSLFVGPINELALGVAASLREAGSHIIFATAESPKTTFASAARSLDAVIHEVDMDNPKTLAEQVNALQLFHIAVLNPAWYSVGEFMDSTPSDWDEALRQNFERMIYAAQAAARVMIERKNGGRLIFLSSTSSLMPFLQTSVAGTTLTALGAVARMAAVELGAHNITVNVVARGWIDVDWARPDLHTEGRAFVEEGIPVGRIGRTEDVGALCCFLASEAAQYITGAVIPVDGGYTLTRSAGTSPYSQKR